MKLKLKLMYIKLVKPVVMTFMAIISIAILLLLFINSSSTE